MKPAITKWMPSYERSSLGTDAVSGATVAAVLIPSALAYAAIVGVEPIVGLYTVPLALVAYAVFGGSRLLVVGPDSALAVLAASTLATVATGDDYVQLTIALSFIVGAIFVLFSLLKMGWVADLVPDPVLKGFVQGLVWVTILGQVPDLLGLELTESHDDFWRKLGDIITDLETLQTETALIGVGSVVALFAFRRLAPKVPGSLIVLVGSMVLIATTSLAENGVNVVGEPTGGAFDFGLPSGVSGGQLFDLLPGALAIVVVGFTESMGAAKSAAQVTGEQLDPNEELLALGASNIGAGASGGYVVTGALSKTSVAMSSGGRSQVGNLVAAVLAVLSVLILRPMFQQLASTVLAALIVFAMSGMVDVAYFRRLWRISRSELLLASLAFLGVLTFGVLQGVVIGVVVSLVLLVDHIGRPHGIVLGRTPSGAWHEVGVDANARPVEGLVVFREEVPLVFLNARRVAERMKQLAVDDVQVMVIDASPTSTVDSTGFTAMLQVREDLARGGVEMWVVNPSIRKKATTEIEAGVLGVTMPRQFQSIGDAYEEFQRLDLANELPRGNALDDHDG